MSNSPQPKVLRSQVLVVLLRLQLLKCLRQSLIVVKKMKTKKWKKQMVNAPWAPHLRRRHQRKSKRWIIFPKDWPKFIIPELVIAFSTLCLNLWKKLGAATRPPSNAELSALLIWLSTVMHTNVIGTAVTQKREMMLWMTATLPNIWKKLRKHLLGAPLLKVRHLQWPMTGQCMFSAQVKSRRTSCLTEMVNANLSFSNMMLQVNITLASFQIRLSSVLKMWLMAHTVV